MNFAYPFHVQQEQVRGLKNMKPGTYPAEPIDPEQLVSKCLVVPVPRPLWSGDFLVELNGDIDWISSHFKCEVGECLWIREKHRYHTVGRNGLVIEFADGERRETPIKQDDVRFTDGRWLPPIAMHKLSARIVIQVKEIATRWTCDKKLDMAWYLGIERLDDANANLALRME